MGLLFVYFYFVLRVIIWLVLLFDRCVPFTNDATRTVEGWSDCVTYLRITTDETDEHDK